MKISIIGSGVVGKAVGIGFHMLGNEVIFYDIDENTLLELKSMGYNITNCVSEAVIKSEISFICVPTPTVNHKMDLSYVQEATINVAKALREKDGYHLVVVKSTVLPSTTRTKVIPLLEHYSQLKVGKDFGVCMSPEFLRESSALDDFLKPSRIVIGEYDKRSGDTLERLYTQINAPIFRTDLDTAEMIKYVANCFLATKISFFNEIYIICRKLGLDPHFISEVVSLDPRIGKYGIYGGKPFKGKCLPKDLEAFISFVEEKRLNPILLTAVFHVNKEIAKIQGENHE